MKNLAPIALILSMAGLAQADFVPIPLTQDSYNQDMVVEKTVTAVLPVTTASMDGGTNNNNATWYEMGYNTAALDTGLPVAGSTFVSQSASDHSYKMAPSYTAPNAILLDASLTNATFTFKTPTAFAALSLLTSGGNGGCVFNYTVHFSDGTSETGQTNSPDWYNGANPAYISHGRVNAQGFTFDTVNDPGNVNPRLMTRDLALVNQTKTITSVDLTYISSASGAHSCFMAISGATTAGGAFAPIDVTGYTQDMIVEKEAPKLAAISAFATANLDNGVQTNGNTFYEMGFVTNALTTGLPAAGSILTNFSAPDHRYLLAPDYTTNNAILVDYTDSGSITFATPTAFSGLSFLATAGNGPQTIAYTISFIDGTSETGQFIVNDWYNNTPYAFMLNGRVDVGTSVPNTVNGNNPRVYGADILVQNSKTSITNITVAWAAGNTSGHSGILAVSGTAGAVRPILDNTQPTNVVVYAGAGSFPYFSITGTYSGTAPFTFQWLKGTNGNYVKVSDSASIAGSKTDSLAFTGVSLSDMADYVAVVSNGAGSTTSHVATLTVLSTLPNICASGASAVGYNGSWPAGQNPSYAFDQTTSKYLNFGLNNGQPFKGPVGVVVTPSEGRSIIGGIRFYTADDTTDRDPMDYTLEGSNDGGNTYSLISSNALNLSLNRNAGGSAIDPLVDTMQQVLFNNTVAYSSYRIMFHNVRNNAGVNSMQIGEIELLGTQDTSGFPYFMSEPAPVTVYQGANVEFDATAVGTPNPGVQWTKVANGTTVVLTDGGNISGSRTGSLIINNVGYADAADYVLVATNTIGTAKSAVATLTVLSSMTNILSSNDVVVPFGGEGSQSVITTNLNAFGSNLVNNTTTKWINGGSSYGAASGFPPFGGPVGFVITPALGTTRVSGVRFFTSDDTTTYSDPADYKLEGSLDGTTYSTIVSGSLNLPIGRNNQGSVIDPLTNSLQEILFSNSGVYQSYRVTFSTVRTPASASTLQLAEVQFLGVPAVTGSALTVSTANGKLTIVSTRPGELWSTTALAGANTVWKDEGAINGSMTITPEAGTPAKFYRVVTP